MGFSIASVSASKLWNCLCLSCSSSTFSRGGDTRTALPSFRDSFGEAGTLGEAGEASAPESLCLLARKDCPKNASPSSFFLAVGLFKRSETLRSLEMHCVMRPSTKVESVSTARSRCSALLVMVTLWFTARCLLASFTARLAPTPPQAPPNLGSAEERVCEMVLVALSILAT